MVVEYTVGKPRFAAHEPQLRAALTELKEASASFVRLMAEDMRAYEDVVAARKADAAAQAAANARAIAVPMAIVDLGARIASLLDEIKSGTNPHLVGTCVRPPFWPVRLLRLPHVRFGTTCRLSPMPARPPASKSNWGDCWPRPNALVRR